MRHLAPVLLTMSVVVAACSAGGEASGEAAPSPAVSDDGSLTASVSLEPEHALVGRLVVESDEPTRPSIEVRGPERTFEIPVGESATRHVIPVVGMRGEQDYEITVSDGDTDVVLDLTTGAVPDEFPAIVVETADQARMSEGFTLLNLLRFDDVLDADDGDHDEDDEPGRFGFLVAVDADGEIVWYHRTDHPIGDARMLDDGTILHEYNDTGARRIDLFGQTIEEWAGNIILGPLELDEFGRRVAGEDAVAVDSDSMHHEVSRLDNGNIIAISTERRIYEGFDEPLCGETEDFDGTYDLIADVVIEFTPDGEIVAEYPLADHFDPLGDPRDDNLCGLPFEAVFPNWLYGAQGFGDARDWLHSNGVVVSPDGDALTVSVRHLDAVIQIDRATGELLWRFGPGGDFAIDDVADFAYHQHAPEWQDDGSLLLYDNGVGRPGPGGVGDGVPQSRAVQYRLDADDGTAEVIWEHWSTVDGSPAFAGVVGDADRLDNGNVLVTNGAYQGRDDNVSVQITEVVPAAGGDGGDVVFEIRLDDPDEVFITYRAERVPTFYPTAS